MREPDVNSRQNPRFKATLALRDARERRARGHILVDGAREIGRALEMGVPLVESWVATERVRSDAARTLLPRLATSAAVIETTPELLARLAYGERDEGIVAVFETPPSNLDRLASVLPERPLIAVVERVEKPGNLGALLRSADGAGVDAVIVADLVSDIWNPNAIRASLGTIFSLPLAVCSAAEALAFLRAHDIAVLTARVSAELDYDAADMTAPVALVVGAETSGLTEAWTGQDVVPVGIPMSGLADSLNVSASAAVLFYEARRQRRAAIHELPKRGERPVPETMLIVDIQIKPGRANEFRAAAAALFERTQDEPDTLRYDYYMSDDETRNVNIEVFSNADAFVYHNRNVADIVGGLFENAEVVRIDVIGDVNDDLYAELDGLKLKHFEKLGGVSR